MRSSFFGIEMAWRTTELAKAQLDTISHNLANSSREDYTRQEVRVEAMPGYTVPSRFRNEGAGQLGAGARVAEITRQSNTYLNFVLERQQMRFDQASLKNELLGHLEQITNDSELPKQVDAFFTAWQEVANHPENVGIREALLATSKSTLGSFQQCLANYRELTDNINTRLESAVTSTNSLAAQLAGVNKQIALVTGSGQNPNDLMDQRDVLVRKLISLTGGRSLYQPNGTVTVVVHGRPLVQDFDAFKINPVDLPAGDFQWDADGQAVGFDDGTIKTLLAVRDQVDQRGRAPVEELLNDVVARVNQAHQAGFGLDGVTGRNFFEGTTPEDYTINLEASQVAAGNTAAAGDGSNALQIALLNEQVGPLGMNYTAFMNSLLTRLGTLKQGAATNLQTQTAGLENAKANRAEVSGVSTDEEVMKMLQAQHTLQAAARIMNVMDTVLDKVINGMGLVGR